MIEDAVAAHGVTAHRVIRELARVGFSDVTQILDSEGRLLPSRWPADVKAVVASLVIEEREDGT